MIEPDEVRPVMLLSSTIPISRSLYVDGLHQLAAFLGEASDAQDCWTWEQLEAERQRLSRAFGEMWKLLYGDPDEASEVLEPG